MKRWWRIRGFFSGHESKKCKSRVSECECVCKRERTVVGEAGRVGKGGVGFKMRFVRDWIEGKGVRHLLWEPRLK